MALPEDNRFLYSDDAGCNSRSIGASDMQTHSESTADAPAAAFGKTASADSAMQGMRRQSPNIGQIRFISAT